MTTRNVSAAFDSSADAQSARQQLAELGVLADAIHILQQRAGDHGLDSSGAARSSWLARVRRMFNASELRNAQGRAISHSIFVLTASVDETLLAAAVDTLESSKAIEIDEHQKYWRKNVWRGSAAALAAIDERAVPAAASPAKPLRGGS